MGHRTIRQLCDDEGLSRYMVDTLIRKRKLAHFRLGSHIMIPDEAWEGYIERETVQPCREEIMDQNSAGWKSEAPIISSGQKQGAAASAALARKTAMRLKSGLLNS